MAQPIRWDNVHSRGNGEAMSGINSAGQLFNNGFKQLGDVLQQREAIDAANWQTTRQNNTSAYLDQLSQYRTAEDLRAAQESGALDQLRQSFGFQIDADKVRGAADARAGSLMDQAVQQIGYKNTMTDAAQSADRDRLGVELNSGDPARIAAAQRELATIELRNKAPLMAQGRDAGRQQTVWGQEDQRFTLGQEKGRQEIEASKANVENARGMLGVARMNAGTQAQSVAQQGKQIDFNIETALSDRQTALAAGQAAAVRKGLADNGNLYATDGVYTGQDANELMESMTKNSIGDDAGERSAVIDRINKMAKDGIKIKGPNGKSITIHEIPKAAVKAAIMGAQDNMFNMWNQGYANSVEDNLTEILTKQSVVQGADGKPVLSNRMVTDLDDFRQSIRGSKDAPVPIRPMNPARPPQRKEKY